MKKIAVAFFALTAASAFAGTFSDKDFSDVCKGQKITNYGETLLCTKADDYREVMSAKIGANARLPKAVAEKTLDPIFDLDVLPDADTNGIYNYVRKLNSAGGAVAGYMLIDGYENSEIGVRLKVTHQYNKYGELISADVDGF